MQIELNFSNFTSDGILRVAMGPYLDLMGNIFWGAFFGFIGAAVYANERSIGTTATYLILVGTFTALIFPSSLVSIFGIILAFLFAVILYVVFVQIRE